MLFKNIKKLKKLNIILNLNIRCSKIKIDLYKMKSVKEADMNNNRFKPFSTTLMGSMPRSKELLDLKEKSIKDDKYAEEYKEKVYSETEKIIQMSEEIGIDVVVSGELARDNYMSYIAGHVPGVKLMTMEDLQEIRKNSIKVLRKWMRQTIQ